MTGIELIAEKRKNHFEKKGYSVQGDVEHNDNGELISAAIFCLLAEDEWYPEKWDDWFLHKVLGDPENIHMSHVERLSHAGALIAAEIDRIQFKESDPRDNPLIGEDDSWGHDVDMGAR